MLYSLDNAVCVFGEVRREAVCVKIGHLTLPLSTGGYCFYHEHPISVEFEKVSECGRIFLWQGGWLGRPQPKPCLPNHLENSRKVKAKELAFFPLTSHIFIFIIIKVASRISCVVVSLFFSVWWWIFFYFTSMLANPSQSWLSLFLFFWQRQVKVKSQLPLHFLRFLSEQ